MRVDVTYTFRCTVRGCDQAEVQSWPQQWLLYDHRLPCPVVPLGWAVLGTLLLCPRHHTTLVVDEEEVLLDTALPF
jgi:hypothetical protein